MYPVDPFGMWSRRLEPEAWRSPVAVLTVVLDGDATGAPSALLAGHRATRPGELVQVVLGRAAPPGRPRPWLRDLLVGAGFTPRRGPSSTAPAAAALVGRRERSLPDTVGPGMRVLVCGLNPSLYAADAGVGFARPGNRFWPAALAAGLVSADRDADHALAVDGVGMTDLVKRATRAADELSPQELRDGHRRVVRLCAWLRPRVLCVVGLAGWRAAVDRRAAPGPGGRLPGGTLVHLVPSTSGRNASSSLDSLVAAFSDVVAAAASPPGVPVTPPADTGSMRSRQPEGEW